MRLSNNNRQNKLLSRIALILLVLALGSSVVTAGALSSARSLAMGGTSTAWANGVDAAKFNPAHLRQGLMAGDTLYPRPKSHFVAQPGQLLIGDHKRLLHH